MFSPFEYFQKYNFKSYPLCFLPPLSLSLSLSLTHTPPHTVRVSENMHECSFPIMEGGLEGQSLIVWESHFSDFILVL